MLGIAVDPVEALEAAEGPAAAGDDDSADSEGPGDTGLRCGAGDSPRRRTERAADDAADVAAVAGVSAATAAAHASASSAAGVLSFLRGAVLTAVYESAVVAVRA